MFLEHDDLWLAIYLQIEKKSVFKNFNFIYSKIKFYKDIVYEQNLNSKFK